MAAPPIAERHLAHFHRRAPVKEAVRVATTANIAIATALNSGDVLDGITLATDDRVLVKDQTAPAENGLYVVAAVPVRAYDQSTDDPAFGFLVRVRQGTVNAATIWANTNTTAPTIGTTGLTFATFGAPDWAESGDLAAVGETASAGVSVETPRADHVHTISDGAVMNAGYWDVVVSGSAPPVAVSTPSDDDWIVAWINT